MQDLKITIVQPNLVWESRDANISLISRLLDQHQPITDLIVLPETFTTGFTMNNAVAEKMHREAMLWMHQTAGKFNAVVTGSMMMEQAGKFYNRLIWMRPDGTFEQYDKRHLFSLGEEDRNFTKGSHKLIVHLNGWRICPLICYDLRFPVWARNQDDYDLLLFVANWPEKRSYAWRQLLIARAIENLSFVVGVNRVGSDGNGIDCIGESRLIDPLGEVLLDAGNQQDIFTVMVLANTLIKARRTYPFLNDKDFFDLVI